jgi:hypothetical protein
VVFASALRDTSVPAPRARDLVPFTREGLPSSKRLPSNRHNPYFTPEPLLKLPQGLEAFDCANAGTGVSQAPPCKVQPPLEFEGRRTAYPHVEADR